MRNQRRNPDCDAGHRVIAVGGTDLDADVDAGAHGLGDRHRDGNRHCQSVGLTYGDGFRYVEVMRSRER